MVNKNYIPCDQIIFFYGETRWLHSTVMDMLGTLLQQGEYSKGSEQKRKDLHVNGSVWTHDWGGKAL